MTLNQLMEHKRRCGIACSQASEIALAKAGLTDYLGIIERPGHRRLIVIDTIKLDQWIKNHGGHDRV